MTTSNGPLRGTAATPPPSGTSPQQDILSKCDDLDRKIGQGFDLIAKTAGQQWENKEIVRLLEEDVKNELTKQKGDFQKLSKSYVAVFFVGFIAGILSCIAVGTAYYFLRRVTVKTGGYNGN